MGDWLRPGDIFAGYTIEGLIGEGGMGRIYRARHPRLPRAVAIKTLTPTHTSDPTFVTRFEREADHAARVEHPNVVTVYDRGIDDGHPWISMQFISGSDASATVTAEGPMAVDRAVYIISEIARGLDHAHCLGVLHRDVKPANIMLSPTSQGPERVLLTDFGIAKAVAEETGLTETGTIISSLPFAAPEVLYGHPLDGRTDQYALAATLYTLLAGAPPFPGPNQAEIVAGHLSAPVPALAGRRRDVPPALDAVVAGGMAKNATDRYRSCSDFAAAAREALRAPARHYRSGPGDHRPGDYRPTPGEYRSTQSAAPPHPQSRSGPQPGAAPLAAGAVPYPAGPYPSGPTGSGPNRQQPPATGYPSGPSGPPQPTREWTDARQPLLGTAHAAAPPNTPSSSPPEPPRSSNRGMLIGLAVAAVVLLVAGSITAFLVLGDDSDHQASGTDVTTTASSGDTGSGSTGSGSTDSGSTDSGSTGAGSSGTDSQSAEEAIWASASETREEFSEILPTAPLAVGYQNMTCVASDAADRPVYAQFESKFDCQDRGGADFELFTYSDPSGVDQYVNNLPTALPVPYSHTSARGTRMNMYRFESVEGNWVLVLFQDDPYRDNLIQLEIADSSFSQMIDWLVAAPL